MHDTVLVALLLLCLLQGVLIDESRIKVFVADQKSPSHKFVTKEFNIKKFEDVLACLAFVKDHCSNI